LQFSHHRLEAASRRAKLAWHAAVVELDALADAVGPEPRMTTAAGRRADLVSSSHVE
jgi:hypothetical protein